jgi:DNA-binding transcriptional ArsR family regulator
MPRKAKAVKVAKERKQRKQIQYKVFTSKISADAKLSKKFDDKETKHQGAIVLQVLDAIGEATPAEVADGVARTKRWESDTKLTPAAISWHLNSLKKKGVVGAV